LEEYDNANYLEKTGELRWNLVIDNNKTEERSFIYEVKYPKGERIILE